MSQNLFAGRIEDIQPRGRDPKLIPRLRDVGHRGPCAARCPRRPEARPQADPVGDARGRLPARPPAPQVRGRDRRRAEEVPPARRPIRVRRPGPDGAGLVAPLPARRRPRQLRVRRRRSGSRIQIHRSAPRAHGDGDAARHRSRDRRLRPELRRVRAAAGRPSQPVPEPAGERLGRDRGRHGHEHPSAQPGRDDRRGRALPGQPGGDARRSHEVRQGPGLPDRRHDHGAPGHQGHLRDRSRLDQGSRGLAGGGGRRTAARGSS